MSDTTNTTDVIKVELYGPEHFRAIAPKFGIAVQNGPGALPKRQLFAAVREAVKAGKAELIETDYFGVDALLGNAKAASKRSALDWTITYRVIDSETNKPGDLVKLTVTSAQVKAIVPDATFQGGKLSTALALIMIGSAEGASVAELKNYRVSDIVRGVESVEEPSESAPEGEDTGETPAEADKATEDEHASESAVEESVKEDTPELVPAESAKTPVKRTRKVSAAKK